MAKAVKPAAKKSVVKKSSPKKADSTNSEIKSIKYADKSAGQPKLIIIFNALRQMLLQFAKGSLQVHGDAPGQVALYSIKDIELLGKKRSNTYFAGLLVQKGYVGFYLMAVYYDTGLKKELAPELLKCLKGKACFHIKKMDDALMQQVQHALQAAYGCFEKKGWV